MEGRGWQSWRQEENDNACRGKQRIGLESDLL